MWGAFVCFFWCLFHFLLIIWLLFKHIHSKSSMKTLSIATVLLKSCIVLFLWMSLLFSNDRKQSTVVTNAKKLQSADYKTALAISLAFWFLEMVFTVWLFRILDRSETLAEAHEHAIVYHLIIFILNGAILIIYWPTRSDDDDYNYVDAIYHYLPTVSELQNIPKHLAQSFASKFQR